MKKILILNLKMNLTYDEALNYTINIKDKIKDNYQVIICPSFIYLNMFKDAGYPVGAQNVFYLEKGSYTGEISPLQLNSMDISYAIVGHSERRTYFHETNDLIEKKINGCLKNNLKPILCIGETLEEKQQNKTEIILKDQILSTLSNISKEDLNTITIAYEPVWAIGSGLTPSTKEIGDTIAFIKEIIMESYNVNINVLYGGSVNKENIKDIINANNVDGVLIGSASVDSKYLIDMINNI